MNENPLKRVCDHDKYKAAPCPNAGVPLDEYWDTKLQGGGWGSLCFECTMNFGYLRSQITTHMVWSDKAGCYIKKGRDTHGDNL